MKPNASSPARAYGAIAYLPRNRWADLHGLVRVIVWADNLHHARSVLKRVGVKRLAFLAESKSVVEREICSERQQAGAPLCLDGTSGYSRDPSWRVCVCALNTAYLVTEYYFPLREA
jgi:hypothetical protein